MLSSLEADKINWTMCKNIWPWNSEGILMDKSVSLVDYSTYLHRSMRRECLACREIVLPPQKDRVFIFEDVTKRDMTFTDMTEKFFVLRGLNVEHIHLREVNEDCCESDNPGKVWTQKFQNYEHSGIALSVLLQYMVIHKKDLSRSMAASVTWESPQNTPLAPSVLLHLLNSVFCKRPFPTRKTVQLRLKL